MNIGYALYAHIIKAILFLPCKKLVDLNYYVHQDSHDLHAVIQYCATSFGYIPYIKDRIQVVPVKHMRISGTVVEAGTAYYAFAGRNGFFHIPFNTHRFIKKQNPGYVLVQGLVFPLQVLALRLLLGSSVKLFVQHHGEQPFANGIKRWLQRQADKYITGYLFTASGNAATWVQQGIICTINKCHEVPEAATYLQRQNADSSRQKTGITGTLNYLWVGRLNGNKDPLCVLKAFEAYAIQHKDVRLYMIYQDADLLPEINACIAASAALQNAVQLVGSIPHETLADWYTAADFFISGSHREGSGYALIECMACGCIPIVTDIPPFMALTDNGKYALSYPPGNNNALLNQLLNSRTIDKAIWRKKYYAALCSTLIF